MLPVLMLIDITILPEELANIIQSLLLKMPKRMVPEKYKFTDKIPGRLALSIVFPKYFTWSRKTDVNERLPYVEIKNGVIKPTSGPLCKKSVGGCGGLQLKFYIKSQQRLHQMLYQNFNLWQSSLFKG